MNEDPSSIGSNVKSPASTKISPSPTMCPAAGSKTAKKNCFSSKSATVLAVVTVTVTV